MSEEVLTGKVKWFGPARGFGFLIGDDGKEYFVHFKDIKMSGYKTLSENQRVQFKLKKVEKGIAACEVTVIE